MYLTATAFNNKLLMENVLESYLKFIFVSSDIHSLLLDRRGAVVKIYKWIAKVMGGGRLFIFFFLRFLHSSSNFFFLPNTNTPGNVR